LSLPLPPFAWLAAGESGTTIPIEDPSRLAGRLFRYYCCHSHDDAYGDLVRFVQATTDVLDEATNDIYAFLEAIDHGPETSRTRRSRQANDPII
jgi:hypothetical protein